MKTKLANIKQRTDAELASLQFEVSEMSANGAIDKDVSSVVITKGGVAALTLENPSADQNGHVMTIVSATAHAHTVTNTSGFNDGGTASDVATFGGAKGDAMVIVAFNQRWYTLTLRNVTLA